MLIIFRGQDDAAFAGTRVEPGRHAPDRGPFQQALQQGQVHAADKRRVVAGQQMERAVAQPDVAAVAVGLVALRGQGTGDQVVVGQLGRLAPGGPAGRGAAAAGRALQFRFRAGQVDDLGEQFRGRAVIPRRPSTMSCLLYTSDAADE